VRKTRDGWRKSSYSGNTSECVEVAPRGRVVGVRDSKDPERPHIAVGVAAWDAMVSDIKSR
jgi:hypothetical protein